MMYNIADFLLVQLSLTDLLYKKHMIKSCLCKLHQHCTVLSIW